VRLSELLQEAPAAVSRGLEVIAESLANFVRYALQAGADGIFLSVRDDWVDTETNGVGVYDRLVSPATCAFWLRPAREASTFCMFAVRPATLSTSLTIPFTPSTGQIARRDRRSAT
jgi:hypothetical protein